MQNDGSEKETIHGENWLPNILGNKTSGLGTTNNWLFVPILESFDRELLLFIKTLS